MQLRRPVENLLNRFFLVNTLYVQKYPIIWREIYKSLSYCSIILSLYTEITLEYSVITHCFLFHTDIRCFACIYDFLLVYSWRHRCKRRMEFQICTSKGVWRVRRTTVLERIQYAWNSRPTQLSTASIFRDPLNHCTHAEYILHRVVWYYFLSNTSFSKQRRLFFVHRGRFVLGRAHSVLLGLQRANFENWGELRSIIFNSHNLLDTMTICLYMEAFNYFAVGCEEWCLFVHFF